MPIRTAWRQISPTRRCCGGTGVISDKQIHRRRHGGCRFACADRLAWIATLPGQNIRVDASRIEALSTPGLVSVTATFARAKAQ